MTNRTNADFFQVLCVTLGRTQLCLGAYHRWKGPGEGLGGVGVRSKVREGARGCYEKHGTGNPTTPGLSRHGGRVKIARCQSARPSFSVPRVRPDSTCRVFSTILRIVVHDFARQLFDQLLADHAILAGS